MIAPYACDPPRNGGMVRIVNLRRGLAKYFDLTFVAPRGSSEPTDVKDAVSVVVDGRRFARLRALRGPRPYHSELWRHRQMYEVVERELAGSPFDVIYCHHIYSAEYVPRNCAVPIVIDQQN